MTAKLGKIYLVGAGPGDVGLITVRAVECLRMADAVIYDNLANPALLEHCPAACQRIFAGKESSIHHKSQQEINELLAGFAFEGLKVVRLKGGDPFLFGRGGEEAGYLSERGIPFEVVPGVTSAIAVPAYAGIPVTHRMVNGSLHVVTAHENVEGVGPEVDWTLLARSQGTIVFLMGVGNLSRITKSLVEHGMAPETPAALIRWGTLPEQETLVSTVGKIAAAAKEAGLRPPAVGVIGKVVELRSQLQWFEKRPLYNRRIAVTRPAGQQEQITEMLRSFGADVLFSPTIQLKPRPLDDFFHSTMEEIETGKFDWILFSSANAVQIFIQRLIESRRDVRLLHVLQIASVGARTSDALLKAGLRADLTATDSRQEGVVDAMAELHVERVLMPQAAQARDEFAQAMSNRKIPAVQLPLYDIVANPAGIERLVEHLRRKRIDMICFTSALTFTSLADALSPDEIVELLSPVALAAIGPVTSDAIRRVGLSPALQPTSASAEALATAMVEFFAKNPDFRVPKP